MILIYFRRPHINPQRIFIGFKFDNNKMYRIGFKTIICRKRFDIVRYLYDIDNENIKIIENSDIKFIDKKRFRIFKFL